MPTTSTTTHPSSQKQKKKHWTKSTGKSLSHCWKQWTKKIIFPPCIPIPSGDIFITSYFQMVNIYTYELTHSSKLPGCWIWEFFSRQRVQAHANGEENCSGLVEVASWPIKQVHWDTNDSSIRYTNKYENSNTINTNKKHDSILCV